jgi:predicted secreted Zn-dependent protease
MDHRLARKITKRKMRDEERLSPAQARSAAPHPEKALLAGETRMTVLQHNIGNRAVQGLMVQSQHQVNEEEKVPNQPASLGKVVIERPIIQTYDVNGNSLDEVMVQVKTHKDWLRYEYEYDPKVKNGVVSEVDVTVKITIQQPRWVGTNLEHLTPTARSQWQEVLEFFQAPEEKHETTTELPSMWLPDPGWKEAPDSIKNTWRGMLQAMQNHETSLFDIASRRSLVLQKLLLNQPENQTKAIFDKFITDQKKEDEQYAKQREPGKEQQKVSINPNDMVQ